MKPPSDRRAADNLPVQPFHAQVAMQEYDPPQGPVYSHSAVHIVMLDVIIEKRTSPAARRPYAGMNAGTHTIGFTILIKTII